MSFIGMIQYNKMHLKDMLNQIDFHENNSKCLG